MWEECDKTQDIAAHYELICADWRAGKEVYLAGRFDKHGQAGLDFLLAQLSGAKEEKIRVLTAALAAEVLSKLRHLDFYAPYCDRLVGPLCALLATGDVQLRRKVVIALGWVGGEGEIDVLAQVLFNDDDALCRAWGAASLMQMSFHRAQGEELRLKTRAVFAKAISEEKDPYACGVMIQAAQELFSKRWVSASAVEGRELEKIEKGRRAAVRFLSKG